LPDRAFHHPESRLPEHFSADAFVPEDNFPTLSLTMLLSLVLIKTQGQSVPARRKRTRYAAFDAPAANHRQLEKEVEPGLKKEFQQAF
jgi:hypothetical protein